MSAVEVKPTQAPARSSVLRILLGILFLIPAILACGLSQLALSLGTFINSLEDINLTAHSEFVGMANYGQFFQDPSAQAALGFTLQTVLVRLLLVAVFPPLLAWGISGLGRWPRLALRVFFVIPLAAYAPVMLALMWWLALAPGAVFGDRHWLSQPDAARQFLLFVDGLQTLGLACALGLIFYLPAFRGAQGSGRFPWKVLLIPWGVGLLGAVASAFQTFTLSYALTRGGPANATLNIVMYMYKVAFQFLRIGMGSAVSGLLLLLLAILGLVAGLLVILSGLKIQFPSSSGADAAAFGGAAPVAAKPGGTVPALVLGLLVGIPVVCLGLGLFLTTLGSFAQGADPAKVLELIPPLQTMTNTFVPPLVAVVFIQLPLTWLAAFGIGGLRPLGRHSEWLLLPFCPWLFVGMTPLSLATYQVERSAGLVGTFFSLVPPLAISVPILLILTLFYKGQAQTLRASGAGAYFKHLILPSLPLLLLMIGAGLFVGMQDPFWGLVAVSKSNLFPLNSALLMLAGVYATSRALIAAAVLVTGLPLVLVSFLALAAFQLFYLDRLTISAGREE